MKKLIFIGPAIAILLFTVMIVVVGGKKPALGNTTGINVVVAENFYGDIAMQIGGDKINVVSILSNPNLDPHEYEATIDDGKLISDADIVIENGLGYDPFMDKILTTAGNKAVINVGQLARLTDQDNPHVWYNLDIIKDFAAEFRDKLIKLDSSNQDYYDNNYRATIATLSQIDTACQAIKNSYSNTKVLATERVADYILLRCGLVPIKNDFQKATEEGNDPSIDAINFFENILKTRQAKILLYNYQAESQITEKERDIATQHNVLIVGVTETMPQGMTYVEWMLSELSDITNALNK